MVEEILEETIRGMMAEEMTAGEATAEADTVEEQAKILVDRLFEEKVI